jgi:hypothetical protein
LHAAVDDDQKDIEPEHDEESDEYSASDSESYSGSSSDSSASDEESDQADDDDEEEESEVEDQEQVEQEQLAAGGPDAVDEEAPIVEEEPAVAAVAAVAAVVVAEPAEEEPSDSGSDSHDSSSSSSSSDEESDEEDDEDDAGHDELLAGAAAQLKQQQEQMAARAEAPSPDVKSAAGLLNRIEQHNAVEKVEVQQAAQAAAAAAAADVDVAEDVHDDGDDNADAAPAAAMVSPRDADSTRSASSVIAQLTKSQRNLRHQRDVQLQQVREQQADEKVVINLVTELVHEVDESYTEDVEPQAQKQPPRHVAPRHAMLDGSEPAWSSSDEESTPDTSPRNVIPDMHLVNAADQKHEQPEEEDDENYVHVRKTFPNAELQEIGTWVYDVMDFLVDISTNMGEVRVMGRNIVTRCANAAVDKVEAERDPQSTVRQAGSTIRNIFARANQNKAAMAKKRRLQHEQRLAKQRAADAEKKMEQEVAIILREMVTKVVSISQASDQAALARSDAEKNASRAKEAARMARGGDTGGESDSESDDEKIAERTFEEHAAAARRAEMREMTKLQELLKISTQVRNDARHAHNSRVEQTFESEQALTEFYATKTHRVVRSRPLNAGGRFGDRQDDIDYAKMHEDEIERHKLNLSVELKRATEANDDSMRLLAHAQVELERLEEADKESPTIESTEERLNRPLSREERQDFLADETKRARDLAAARARVANLHAGHLRTHEEVSAIEAAIKALDHSNMTERLIRLEEEFKERAAQKRAALEYARRDALVIQEACMDVIDGLIVHAEEEWQEFLPVKECVEDLVLELEEEDRLRQIGILMDDMVNVVEDLHIESEVADTMQEMVMLFPHVVPVNDALNDIINEIDAHHTVECLFAELAEETVEEVHRDSSDFLVVKDVLRDLTHTVELKVREAEARMVEFQLKMLARQRYLREEVIRPPMMNILGRVRTRLYYRHACEKNTWVRRIMRQRADEARQRILIRNLEDNGEHEQADNLREHFREMNSYKQRIADQQRMAELKSQQAQSNSLAEIMRVQMQMEKMKTDTVRREEMERNNQVQDCLNFVVDVVVMQANQLEAQVQEERRRMEAHRDEMEEELMSKVREQESRLKQIQDRIAKSGGSVPNTARSTMLTFAEDEESDLQFVEPQSLEYADDEDVDASETFSTVKKIASRGKQPPRVFFGETNDSAISTGGNDEADTSATDALSTEPSATDRKYQDSARVVADKLRWNTVLQTASRGDASLMDMMMMVGQAKSKSIEYEAPESAFNVFDPAQVPGSDNGGAPAPVFEVYEGASIGLVGGKKKKKSNADRQCASDASCAIM